MSKFEKNRITRKLIRAILRFCSSFLPPKCSKNNIQILFCEHLGGRKEERDLRIALINFLVMRFFSNFDTSFTHEYYRNPKEEDSSCKIDGFMATYIPKLKWAWKA